MIAALVFVIALSAAAQTGSENPQWEFSTTLKDATDVLVGDIVSGNAADAGNIVRVRATVRVVRVLRGSAAPGAELSINWEYRPAPSQPPSVTSNVPGVRGLWFLRKEGDRLDPLRAAYFMPTMGVVYLPAARNSWHYQSNAPLSAMVAHEIGAALEEMALANPADPVPREMPPPGSGARPEWANTRSRFHALAAGLHALEKTATAAVYSRFSSSADANLMAIGLQGRFNAGDDSAVFEIERNAAVLAPVFNAGSLRLTGSIASLPAAHAVGRMAVGETVFQEMERLAPSVLPATRRLEVLPYLTIMLGSSAPNTRGAAMMSLCRLLQGSAWWRPEMAGHCPSISLIDDDREQLHLRFWNAWWSSSRDAIGNVVALPRVARPGRYDGVPYQRFEAPPVDLERRFMSHAFATRFYASRPGPRPPDVLGAVLDGNDLLVWRQILGAAGAKMEAIQKQAAEIRNAARVAGAPPDANRYRALQDEERAWARQALDELRRAMSSSGWQLVESYLKDANSVRVPAGK